jgi:hypothetical protein
MKIGKWVSSVDGVVEQAWESSTEEAHSLKRTPSTEERLTVGIEEKKEIDWEVRLRRFWSSLNPRNIKEIRVYEASAA